MKIGGFEVSDETMHPAILEPEDLALTIFKTGTWRYMRPVFRENVSAPCTDGCPAGVKIRDCLKLVREDKLREALELIREDNPLPAITGRVCYHPCETECNRSNFDQTIAIQSIERFVGDYGLGLPLPEIKIAPQKERVAIIGSGPAGLTAGYYLAKQGYQVTIFEALPVVGGMLAVGIPEYRLPRDILQRSVDYIKESGVEIKTNTPVGEKLTLDNLNQDGYAAVLIVTGLHQGRTLPIPGTKFEGVMTGLSLLRNVRLGKSVKVGKKVLVLGGGNVAFDCARTALRLGAGEAHIACVEAYDSMPAHPSEIKEGEEEGIVIHPSRAFTKIIGEDGHVRGVECVRLRSMEFDEEGNLHFDAIQGSEHVLSADTVIFATGQATNLDFLSGVANIETSKRGTIAVDPVTLSTTLPYVFAGGDVCSGPARVVDAIAAGKKAALSIDATLTGKPLVTEGKRDVVRYEELNTTYFWSEKRAEANILPLTQRATSFDEVDRGLDKAAVTDETSRCFHCGACNMCGNCWFFCPDNTISKKDEHFEVDVEYCKGCGICAKECPCGVIVMEEESKWQ